MTHLIVFRTYPDIDHLAPLAWKLLEEGEEVHAVIAPGYDPSKDHRIAVLRRYPRFHLHQVGTGLRGRLRNTLPWALLTILRSRARTISVEWGYGFTPGFDDLRSRAGVAAVLRAFVGSFARGARQLDPYQTRVNYFVAARLLGRATFCLPHGLSIKLDAATTDEARAKLSNGGFDYRDRNRFTRYVLNTEHHRRFHLAHAKGDPDVMETWGALRWSPAWFELNRAAAPRFAWPRDADKLKVVLMVPKWRNRVHKEAVVELVQRVHALDFVSFAMKGHARLEAGSADPLRSAPGIDWDRILDVTKADSVSLIEAADAVLDVGSSIGLEVVLQGKVLINPFYIHDLRTLFDEIPGSCVLASDADDVVAALESAAAGLAPDPTPEAMDELLRRAVYGDREPFDVPQLYYDRITDLAT